MHLISFYLRHFLKFVVLFIHFLADLFLLPTFFRNMIRNFTNHLPSEAKDRENAYVPNVGKQKNGETN